MALDYNTDFKSNLVEKFKDKGLTDNSIKMYVRNLEKLNDNMPLKNFNFLKNTEDILSKLEKYKDNTKRGYIISITSALSTDKNSKPKKKMYEEYFKIMINMNKELKQKESLNEKTETQSKNWVNWEEVDEKFNELGNKVESFVGSKEINSNNYNTLLSYVILGLYYYLPPRRNLDYQKMNIVKSYNNELPNDLNYLDYDNQEFIFNVFKTAKKEGQQRIKIPDQLMELIKTYLKYHPVIKGKKITKTINTPFLVYYSGNNLDKVNSITRILNKVFGKSVGSSMLRHSFLSNKYADVLKNQKEDAKLMGHSVSQQKDYVKID
jgi:integrase